MLHLLPLPFTSNLRGTQHVQFHPIQPARGAVRASKQQKAAAQTHVDEGPAHEGGRSWPPHPNARSLRRPRLPTHARTRSQVRWRNHRVAPPAGRARRHRRHRDRNHPRQLHLSQHLPPQLRLLHVRPLPAPVLLLQPQLLPPTTAHLVPRHRLILRQQPHQHLHTPQFPIQQPEHIHAPGEARSPLLHLGFVRHKRGGINPRPKKKTNGTRPLLLLAAPNGELSPPVECRHDSREPRRQHMDGGQFKHQSSDEWRSHMDLPPG